MVTQSGAITAFCQAVSCIAQPSTNPMKSAAACRCSLSLFFFVFCCFSSGFLLFFVFRCFSCISLRTLCIRDLFSKAKTRVLNFAPRESRKSVICVIRGVPARDLPVIRQFLRVIRGSQILKKGIYIVFFLNTTNLRITHKTGRITDGSRARSPQITRITEKDPRIVWEAIELAADGP